MKNKFLSFLIFALTLTAFLAGYIMVKRGVSTENNTRTGTILDKFDSQQTTDSSQQTTNDHNNQPFLVADRRIDSFTNSLNKNSVLYAEKGTGRVYEISLEDKSDEIISNSVIPGFLSSLWSPNKKEIINSMAHNSELTFAYHNIETGRASNLNMEISSIAFSPDGNQIAYYSKDSIDNTNPEEGPLNSEGGTGKITISQPDGSYPKKIFSTRLVNLELSWPTKESLAFKTSAGEIFLLTESGGLTKLTEARNQPQERWSKNGTKVLLSQIASTDKVETALVVKDIQSTVETNLNLTGDASKCAWSIDNIHIFCETSDMELYQINISDGSKKLIAELNYPIKNPTLSSVEDQLLFINLADEKLYAIKIAD